MLLVPRLEQSSLPLLDLIERLALLRQQFHLRFELSTVAEQDASRLLPTLHALGAFLELSEPNVLRLPSLYDPFNPWTEPRPGERMPWLDELRKHLFTFRITLGSDRPIDPRTIALVERHLGVGALAGRLTVVDGTSDVLALADLVQAANAPLVFQLPLALRYSGRVRVEDPPAFLPPVSDFAEGLLIGEVETFRSSRAVRIRAEDLARHAYVIGQTGTGKTTLLKTLVASAVEAAEQAVFVLDPHGDLSEELLRWVPPEHQDRTLYVDFSDPEHFAGLNVFDVGSEAQIERAVGDTDQMFLDMYGPEIWGPRLQDAYRNIAKLVSLDQELGGTLLDLIWAWDLSHKPILERFEAIAKAPGAPLSLRLFLEQIRMKRYGDGSLSEMAAYYRSKFSPFTDNLFTRNILGQSKTTLDFARFAREKRFCIFNLSKGRLSARYAALVGRLLTIRIFQSALESVSLPPDERPPALLVLDEFQNFVSRSIEDILAEARKFRLSLVLAHQYLNQLKDPGAALNRQSSTILDAILGNVGSFAAFRVSGMDSQRIADEFGGQVEAGRLATLPNWRAVCRLTQRSTTLPPFVCRTRPLPARHDTTIADEIRRRSRAEVCRPRAQIEAEIISRFERARGVVSVPDNPLASFGALFED